MVSLLPVAALTGLLRLAIIIHEPLSSWLSQRIELTSPITSWTSLMEGVELYRRGIDPYSGDVFHGQPLLLYLFSNLEDYHYLTVPLLFVVCDILTAFLLRGFAGKVIRYVYDKQMIDLSNGIIPRDAREILINPKQLVDLPNVVALFYLANPLIIATCGIKSLLILDNFIMACCLFSVSRSNKILCVFFLAFATYMSFYPIFLVVPSIWLLIMNERINRSLTVLRFTSYLVAYFLWLAGFLGLSYLMMGSKADFLRGTWGTVLAAPNLTPNMGVFWYLFIEMFEHFRPFFMCVFQLHIGIYVLPLCVRLHDNMYSCLWVLCGLIAVFKSYPNLGDASLYISLLPIWSYTFGYLRQVFVIMLCALVSIVMAPFMFRVWLVTFNPNFFYSMTLIYCVAQIFLIGDVFYAVLRYRYSLVHGLKAKQVEGQTVDIILGKLQ